MAVTYIGSARHDENGKYAGGKAGDQLQNSNTLDTAGEVSAQPLNSFVGSRKWYLIRPKKAADAITLAQAMLVAINNPKIGYDQGERLGVVNYGVDSKVLIEADCSSLVRACIKKATGKDPGNFTTANEVQALAKTGLFDAAKVYTSTTKVYVGDIFVTKTKGHTGICILGESRITASGKYVYNGLDYSSVFNPDYYAARYGDLKAVYGSNASKLFEHFYTFGMKEGRQAIDTFNVTIYRAKYTDLQAAFGSDLKAYYEHYIIFGQKEGRTAI